MTDAVPELLFSPALRALGVPHAFTTRRGGLSPAPFDSLNLGNPSDLPPDRRDPRERILANWSRVLSAIGCAGRELVEVHQVHGAAVHEAARGRPTHPGLPPGTSTKADAIVTDDPTRVAAVRVADCAPVLLAGAAGEVVAAVHAGWRGAAADVAGAAVLAMRRHARGPLVAAIGPCIGVDAFEVGLEVARAMHAALGDDAARVLRPGRPGTDRAHLDLRAALRIQLARAGVETIDDVPGCTASEPDRFFSHRRDAGLTGRMAGLIGPR